MTGSPEESFKQSITDDQLVAAIQASNSDRSKITSANDMFQRWQAQERPKAGSSKIQVAEFNRRLADILRRSGKLSGAKQTLVMTLEDLDKTSQDPEIQAMIRKINQDIEIIHGTADIVNTMDDMKDRK